LNHLPALSVSLTTLQEKIITLIITCNDDASSHFLVFFGRRKIRTDTALQKFFHIWKTDEAHNE